MRHPPDDLVHTVRTGARAWALARNYRLQEVDDVEGDALLFLCSYEPPEGWDVYGATMRKLYWHLVDCERARARQRVTHRVDVEPEGLHAGAVDDGYAQVELELMLDVLTPHEREALLAGATAGDSAVLARREGVSEDCIAYRRRRARARLRAELERDGFRRRTGPPQA